jgi:hypothetical protein
MYAERLSRVQVDLAYYMIHHTHGMSPDQILPLGPFTRWLPFGFDPFIHPLLPEVVRDKVVIQIGSAYPPRPAVWNHLRAVLDGAPPVADAEYLERLYETPSTLFGREPSYRGLAIAHNRARVALSASNCDFSPMRTCEAYGMGCVLVSDDVPAIRAVLGPPLSEGGFWVAHDGTLGGTAQATALAAGHYETLSTRGIAHVYRHHTYMHRAKQILADAGLQGATRAIAWVPQ